MIIRNPYDAFVAEWTRRDSGHIGTTNENQFGMCMCIGGGKVCVRKRGYIHNVPLMIYENCPHFLLN